MDWIETYAEKCRQYLQNAPIVQAAVFYFIIAILGSLACTSLTVNLASLWIHVMEERTPSPKQAIFVLRFVRQGCPYLYLAVSVVLAGKLYTKNKIEAALSEIRLAVKSMAAGDLSFEPAWQSRDEFGILAKDLETLRKTLKREKQVQWKMGEMQRTVNAAFAHDIRTPLTVMNGYTEFLQKYVPQGKVSQQMLLEKLERISFQGSRLLSFSQTMATLQTLEQREVSCRRQHTAEVYSRIQETALALKKEGQHLLFTSAIAPQQTVLADLNLILEAFENVCQNAVRYASQTIEITVRYAQEELTVTVKDDGNGFSQKALRQAGNAYFGEQKEGKADGGTHFGIGLFIAQMLCQKHGGSLTLHNSIEGGAIVTLSFYAGRLFGLSMP